MGKSGRDKGRHGESWDMLGWKGTMMWNPELERGPPRRLYYIRPVIEVS